MKNKLLIIGASGHGKVVADIALKMKRWQSVVFLDDDENIKTTMGIEVIGKSIEAFELINDYDILVGIGNNAIRKKIQENLETKGATLPVLIHPTAIVGEEVCIAPGTVVMAGAVINCCTNIGKGCIINTAATIDHDNIIGDYVHVSPGSHLAGSVKVGQQTWLGIGSIVSNNLNITNNCIVGAGAVVNIDLTESGTYVGVPVRRV
ncbi:acetyltransferase [Rossellomorea vietnamensis]|uniref:acetyltransferase n=1 Tax=Rossellomorea vietnamensis TaxID=218284 RepID=UPI001E2ACB29|nr:acetyltransferase [Rossellomorea vietnamensis]MCC5803208.1 acetyltransferase [Rossellomorea vietnamensis]